MGLRGPRTTAYKKPRLRTQNPLSFHQSRDSHTERTDQMSSFGTCSSNVGRESGSSCLVSFSSFCSSFSFFFSCFPFSFTFSYFFRFGSLEEDFSASFYYRRCRYTPDTGDLNRTHPWEEGPERDSDTPGDGEGQE